MTPISSLSEWTNQAPLEPVLQSGFELKTEPKTTERFFSAILKKVESKTHAEARRDISLMIKEMEYQAKRTEIILGTKGEQDEFFSRLESLLINPGAFDTAQLKENIHAIIEEEFSKGITRAKSLNLSLGVDLMRPGKDVAFNFPMVDINTTLVPIDLHLSFDPTHTVGQALNRLSQQYRWRFNAIVLLNSDKTPRGLISTETLQSYSPDTFLGELPLLLSENFGTLDTPKTEIEERMFAAGVNIFPIIDREKNTLIGIFTHESVVIKETRFYTATLQAQVGEYQLRGEVQENN